MANMVDKQCKSVEWYTPPEILDCVRGYSLEELRREQIGYDPASNAGNYTQALEFTTAEDDGLRTPWDYQSFRNGLVWVNPPYGKQLEAWCAKISAEARKGAHILALLPGNRFETMMLQEYILRNSRLTAVCFIDGRVDFCDEKGQIVEKEDPKTGKKKKSSNIVGSVLYLFNGGRRSFAEAFESLGPCFSMVEVRA